MYEEYSQVSKLIMKETKIQQFLSHDYYKILHLLSGEFLYRPHFMNKIVLSQYKTPWYNCPVVLTLPNAKGFVRASLDLTRSSYPVMSRLYGVCGFNEFDYIPVSKNEALRAYNICRIVGSINDTIITEQVIV